MLERRKVSEIIINRIFRVKPELRSNFCPDGEAAIFLQMRIIKNRSPNKSRSHSSEEK